MSQRDAAVWLRVQRRAATLSPALRDELLAAYRVLRESLSDRELARLIASGQIDQVLDDALLDRAFLPLREKLRQAVERGFKSTIPDLPRAGLVDGTLGVGFDQLSPDVITAVRKLDSRVINTLKDDVRETVRAYIENGLRDGKAPATVARELRPLLGLAPNQAEYIQNYRTQLEAGSQDALDRKLRDKRFDYAVRNGDLTPEKIDRMVGAYEKRWIKLNAETNARTATLDAMKLGQRLSWQDAIDRGIVNAHDLMERWVTVGDDRVRDEHQAMNGEEIPFGGTYSNGESIPGESTWNCRCISRVFVKRQPHAQAA